MANINKKVTQLVEEQQVLQGQVVLDVLSLLPLCLNPGLMRSLISFQPGSPTASTSPSPAPPAFCHTAAPPLQTALLPIRPVQVHFQAEEFSKLTWPLFHTVASIMMLPSHTCHQWGKVSQTQRRQSFNPIRAFWSYSEHLVLSALGEICITFLTSRNTVISSN